MSSRIRAAALASLSACVLTAACSSPAPAPPPPPQAEPPVASTPVGNAFVVAPDLPPLPAAGVARAPRSPEVVRAVYEFAAKHPEVLSYVPCFCGCESSGHQHNDDCFVGSRGADGKVTSWDSHGLT